MKKKAAKQYYRNEKMLIKIGKNLRKSRVAIGISQKMLANEIGSDCSQVNRMELGKVNFRISYLFRMAKALEIDPGKLLT
jgi:predicted transcriptional regulator